MEIIKHFSLKDFFNYFFAGCLWICNFLLLLFQVPNISNKLTNINLSYFNNIYIIIMIFIITYTIGFVFSEIGALITCFSYRILGDPLYWVFDHENAKYGGKRLYKPIIKRVEELFNKIFGFESEKLKERPDLFIYQIRLYVLHKGGIASEMAARSYDLSIFAESILIPVPLLFAVLAYLSIIKIHNFLFYNEINIVTLQIIKFLFSFTIFILLFFIILKRHLKLREYWIKNTCRAFVVLGNDVIKDEKL